MCRDAILDGQLLDSAYVRTGVFGFCSPGIASISFDSSSLLGTKTIGPSGCSHLRLGYDIPNSLFEALDTAPEVRIGNTQRSLIKGLTYVFVLFPIG